MAKRTTKSNGLSMTDPRENLASTANKEKETKKFERGQQLSDKYINGVAKGMMTYEQAKAKQEQEDKKVANTITSRPNMGIHGNKGGKSTTRKAKHYLDSRGNKIAY